MNISTSYSTTNQAYKHLSEAELGKKETYLFLGIKPSEIARRLGRNLYTITREMNRRSTIQVKKLNGQKVHYQHYYADTAKKHYHHGKLR